MFTGDNSGKAKEAIEFYTSIFENSNIGEVSEYDENTAPNAVGKVAYGEFSLNGNTFAIMDSPIDHAFNITPAISYTVLCDTQEEIDHYWYKLTAVPEAEVCGWLTDKYGVSWQVVPKVLNEMLKAGTSEQRESVTAAYMQMGKFDIAELEKTFQQ